MVKAYATHVGVVLQHFHCGTWAPLSFFSRKLMSAETHYSAFNHDLLRFTQLSTTSSSCSRDPADAPGFHHCLGSFGSSTLCLKQTIMQNPDPGNGGLMGGFIMVGLDIGSCEKGGYLPMFPLCGPSPESLHYALASECSSSPFLLFPFFVLYMSPFGRQAPGSLFGILERPKVVT